jgi:starch phosphorylase
VSREYNHPSDDAMDAASLYEKLGKTIIPLYYNNLDGYLEVMRKTIAINGSYFNSTRMAKQYLVRAYAINTPSEDLELSEQSVA